MKDQVIMGGNGELAVAVPLFRAEESSDIASLNGHALMLLSKKPWAYCLDMGGGTCPLIRADAVEKQCEFLSEL